MTAKDRFFEALKRGPFVFDGALGTQLYERGVYINHSFDSANLSRRDLVRQIHEDYRAAGAMALTTNTFASNRFKLARHGLEEDLEAINRAAVQIAREVARQELFVVGSIGPTGQTPTMLTDGELSAIAEAYTEQASCLLEAGVDLICLETFRQIAELKIALEAVRALDAEITIIAQLAFDAELRTAEGALPERAAMLLEAWGADVLGANCIEGPSVLFDVVTRMREVTERPIIAQPNAGYPKFVNERLVYMANPEYFGVYARRFFQAGVAIVGGCCGTSPEHIQRVSGAARMTGGGRLIVEGAPAPPERLGATSLVGDHAEAVSLERRSALAEKVERVWRTRVDAEPQARVALERDSFVVSVEVNPPRGLDPGRALRAAELLARGGVDVINIADGPRASVRMSNWALGKRVRDELDMEVILHVCARDRNLLGLQADLLAYHALGLHNLVVITGDPPKIGDYPHATAVFDLDSVGLLHMVDHFNHGVDPAGKHVGQVTTFFAASGAEPGAQDYERELRRVELKKAAGASMIMTQPVYDARVLSRFLDDIAPLKLPVLVGLLPLASWRNAEFLHNEVPGMSVPEEVRRRMKAAGDQESARREGILIAQEALLEVKDRVVGAYIMPPFGRYGAALEILACLPGYELPPPHHEWS